MSFGAPLWLWSLLLLPVLALLFWQAEARSAARLRQFVSPRLLGELGATVSRGRRLFRFGLLLLGIGLALVSLAKPRYGYSYEEVKRKGLDLLVAVDTSRSMLANDVPPNRLTQVKLAVQDLMGELRGDRVGLIAFAGRAFLQAPLTIDYGAAAEAVTELDTNIIPEGGTNISAAIDLAVQTFGKSAVGNRALIVFTDGEELAGDSAKVAKAAADAGVRIFTIGVGTPEGSLIPLQATNGTAFVKDQGGQVVKSKLDEKRLREIAEATGGIYLPLAHGPATMRRLYDEGLAHMQAAEIDARASRQPIERYQWPLGAAILALMASLLISERRPVRATAREPKRALAGAILLLIFAQGAQAAAPGLDEYRDEKYQEALQRFQQTLEAHPDSHAADKLHFDAGAAAYKLKDYGKALESFSQALLSKDLQLQGQSHYNLGNTLYQRGEGQKTPESKLKDWTGALEHYEQTLKLQPENKEAQENRDYVKKKIEELKREEEQKPTPTPTPTPSPSPSPSPKDQKKDDKNKDQKQQPQDQQKQDQDKEKQQEQKDQSGEGQDQKQPQQNQPGQSPSPSPSPSPGENQPTPSPSPSPGESGASPSPSPGENGASPSPSPGQDQQGASPTPSPGEGENGEGGEQPTPTATPSGTPDKKPSGDVKGAGEEQPKEPPKEESAAEAEPTEEGTMNAQQAERLLRSMKDEEARVQLDERKAVRRVYKDW